MTTSHQQLPRPVGIEASTLHATVPPPARPLRLEQDATERDALSRYGDLIALLHDCSCASRGWAPFERALAAHLNASEATLMVAGSKNTVSAPEKPYGTTRSTDLPLDCEPDSPRMRAAACWKSDAGHHIAQWVDNARPGFVLGLDLSGPLGVHAQLRIRRPVEHGEFTGRDRAYLTLLLPHLRTAAANSLRYSRALVEHCFTVQLLPPVIIFDRQGAVLQISESVGPLLRRERVMTLHGQQIKMLRPEDATCFQRMLARVLALADTDPSEWQPEAMNIRRGNGQAPIWLIARPMQSTLAGDDVFHVAVFIYADQDREMDVPVTALQHLLGLTPCEATVALQLARGKTVKEVTEELGVSLSTTRTHLRSIFSKTSIDKQTKLVRAVLQGMAMLSCR